VLQSHGIKVAGQNGVKSNPGALFIEANDFYAAPEQTVFNLALRMAEKTHNDQHTMDIHGGTFRKVVEKRVLDYVRDIVPATFSDPSMEAMVREHARAAINKWSSAQAPLKYSRKMNPRPPLKHPKQVQWTEGEYWPSSHYNPSPTVIYKGKELPCGCGSRDDISVWEWGDHIHVLCVNTGLGYVGLKVFDLARAADVGTLPTDHPAKDDEAGLVGEMFMDRDYDIEETFGRRGLEGTSGKKMVEILDQWIG
jgi:hypothetical protein